MSYCRSYTYYARHVFFLFSCYSIHSLWWGTVGSHLIWAWLLMSLYKYVCMFSLLQRTIGFPLRFPTWPDDCVRLTAPDGPPHLLDGDQHKQNISLQTNGLIALMMEDLWEMHNKQPLINKIHFIPFLLQLSLWLLLEMWCAATKKRLFKFNSGSLVRWVYSV